MKKGETHEFSKIYVVGSVYRAASAAHRVGAKVSKKKSRGLFDTVDPDSGTTYITD